jgi:hypothetical protein
VLPGLDVAAIRHYCEQRIPPHSLHQIRVEAQVDTRSVTIVERRAPWRREIRPEWTALGIARLRYVAKTGLWTLYWRDRNQRWHRYNGVAASPNVLALIDEVDRDPTGIFWG